MAQIRKSESQVTTALNTIDNPMSLIPDDLNNVYVEVRGKVERTFGSNPAVILSGANNQDLSWSPIDAGYDLPIGETIIIRYTTNI